MKTPRPPDTLKASGKKFWNKVLSVYLLSDAHDLKRLELAGGCLDEIADGEVELDADGLFIKNRYGMKVEHPAAKSIRENKIVFCRIVRELGLDLDTGEGSRPRRQY